jgi:DNA-directed RNA polymerase subunit M/transcription elongation factor TFIIS
MKEESVSKLFSYVCPSCGGHLETDDSRKLMICRSCGNTYDYDYFSGENLLKAAEEPAAQEPDETEKNRLEIERVIGEINDVFKEISSLS